MSRVLLNNRTLANKISRDFIPFAGSIERLQPSRYGGAETATSRWFQKKAKLAFAEFAPAGWWENFKTYQGFYVMAPNGKSYSYQVVWELTPSEVVTELERALTAYAASPPSKVSIPKADPSSKPLRPPKGASILRVFSRIRPVPANSHESNKGIGRDHMWITRREVKAMLGSKTLPDTVVARLIRFQLVDNVRNVSPAFDDKDVKKANFRSKLRGDILVFEGEFVCQGKTTEGKPFGMSGTVEGQFQLDSTTKKITRCRAFAKTTAHGESTPEAPSKPYSMVFAIVDAYDSVGFSVPPTAYGLSPLFRASYLNPALPKL